MAIRDEAQGRLNLGCEGPARPKRPERLFFALMPDAATAARIHRFGRIFAGGNRRWLQPERLHLSLHHVGDFRRLQSKYLFAAERAARSVSAEAFDVTLRSIATFEPPPSRAAWPPARPLVLLGGAARLFELHRRLGLAMGEHGLKPSPHINPHITLSYGGEPMSPQPIEPISCAVPSFALVHSKLGFGRYDIIGRWSLEG